jgi:hypothetical protein
MNEEEKLKDLKEKLTNKELKDKYFDRQIRIPDWDQTKIENQVALCLGKITNQTKVLED